MKSYAIISAISCVEFNIRSMRQDPDSLSIELFFEPDSPQPLNSNFNPVLREINDLTPLDHLFLCQGDLGYDSPSAHSEASQRGEAAKKKRDSNTIFKTSLSAVRKVLRLLSEAILALIGQDPSYGWVVNDMKVMSKAKNMTVLPCYLAIVRQLGLLSQFCAKWSLNADSIKAKKRKLVEKGQYSETRYEQLLKVMEREAACFAQPDFELAIRQYWGEFRQAGKFERSRQVVLAQQKRIQTKLTSLPQPLGPPRQSKRRRNRKARKEE